MLKLFIYFYFFVNLYTYCYFVCFFLKKFIIIIIINLINFLSYLRIIQKFVLIQKQSYYSDNIRRDI